MRVELLEFIALFESEPEWVHDQGWYYGARFRLERGDETISATIAPDEGEFGVEWFRGDRRLAKFNLVMVTEWVVERRAEVEMLILKCSSDRSVFCVVTLRPQISVEIVSQW